MAFSPDDVRRVATLARLELEPSEVELFSKQLGEIVDYVDQLSAYAGEAADDSQGQGIGEAADDPRPCLERQDFLDNAPATAGDFLAVPAVKARSEGTDS